MRLHRILQGVGGLALLLLGTHVAWGWAGMGGWAAVGALSVAQLVQAAAFGLPALAVLGIGIALQRAETRLAARPG